LTRLPASVRDSLPVVGGDTARRGGNIVAPATPPTTPPRR